MKHMDGYISGSGSAVEFSFPPKLHVHSSNEFEVEVSNRVTQSAARVKTIDSNVNGKDNLDICEPQVEVEETAEIPQSEEGAGAEFRLR